MKDVMIQLMKDAHLKIRLDTYNNYYLQGVYNFGANS